MSTPERRAELIGMAYDVLHRSCPTTERAEYIDPSVARAIAMGYLELAMMPSAIWDMDAQPDPWDVPETAVGDPADVPGVTP